MSITPREAMILSLVTPPNAYQQIVHSQDLDRLAAQFGVTRERVRQIASKLFSEIRSAGSNLEACQPRKAG